MTKILWTNRPPTDEEAAAQALAEAEAEAQALEAAIDTAIQASPEYRVFIRGDMTLTAYREAAANIAAAMRAKA